MELWENMNCKYISTFIFKMATGKFLFVLFIIILIVIEIVCDLLCEPWIWPSGGKNASSLNYVQLMMASNEPLSGGGGG